MTIEITPSQAHKLKIRPTRRKILTTRSSSRGPTLGVVGEEKSKGRGRPGRAEIETARHPMKKPPAGCSIG